MKLNDYMKTGVYINYAQSPFTIPCTVPTRNRTLFDDEIFKIYQSVDKGQLKIVFAGEEIKNPSIIDEIENVIFNNPATIVYWADGTKTVVKCQPEDKYCKETGLAMCILKYACGNKGNYNDVFEKWCK